MENQDKILSDLKRVESIKRTPFNQRRSIKDIQTVSCATGKYIFTLFQASDRHYVEVTYREENYEEVYISRCAIVVERSPKATLQAWIKRNIRA